MKILVFMWLSFFYFVNGQTTKNIIYVNPKPGSKNSSPETNIIIKSKYIIDKSSVNENLVSVIGSKSGIHTGKFILSDDSKTLVFTPNSKFLQWEKVTVELKNGIKTLSAEDIGQFKFEFLINRETKPEDIYEINSIQEVGLEDQSKTNLNQDVQKPESLPTLIVNSSENPYPGYMFFGASSYLMIVDNEAVPIFYRYVGGSIYDFKLQPNGMLTYFIYPITCIGLDSSLNIVKTFQTANGYTVDVHDLRVMKDGHYYIMGKKLVDVDMSQVVSGGDSTAQIIDMAVQEFDTSGNVVFQWDALDHYQITDADDYISLTAHQIDMVHFNSLEIDADSNIILSARNLDEITKIDHITGDIIWRWGGENNQFTFIKDDRGFSRQHDIRQLSNGNFTIFDNGVYHSPQYSSIVEYTMDEQNKIVTLVNRYSHNKVFSRTRGDIQELPNGNKLISWGELSHPAITEIKPDNSIEYEMSFGGNYMRFHTYRFQWQTNLFETNLDSVDFGEIDSVDTIKKVIVLFNDHDSSVTINEFYLKDTSFSIMSELPVIIPGNDSVSLTIEFHPHTNGVFRDVLGIRMIEPNELIARQVYLQGSAKHFISPIEAPLNLVAVPSNNNIELTWVDSSNNESGFVIERKEGDSLSVNEFSEIDTVASNDTSYIDSTVQDSMRYTYRIYAFNNDTTSSFSNYVTTDIITSIKNSNIIKAYLLYQNYPNPFNPITNIEYQIPKAGLVTINIYNVVGQKVRTLINKYQNNGRYTLKFNAGNLSSGIYFYQLKSNQFTDVKKLILMK